MSTRSVIGIVLIILGGACGIVSMVTQGWWLHVTEGSGWSMTVAVGLKTYTETDTLNGVTTVTTGNLRDRYSSLDAAGDAILGCGSVGLFLCLVGIIVWIIGGIRDNIKFQYAAITFNYLGGCLLLIGYVLYSIKINVSYSFILFIFASFLLFAASVIMLSTLLQSNTTSTSHRRLESPTPISPSQSSGGSSWWRRTTTTTTKTTVAREMDQRDAADADVGYIPPSARAASRSPYDTQFDN